MDRGCPAGYSPLVHKELDTSKQLSAHTYIYMNALERRLEESSLMSNPTRVPGLGLVTLSKAAPHITCLTVWTDIAVLTPLKQST